MTAPPRPFYIPADRLGVPEIMEAERKLEMISQDRALRLEYERRRMAYHDSISHEQDARFEGRNEGKREEILNMCEMLGLDISPEQKAQLDGMRLPELETLRLHLKQHRCWPTF